MSQRSPLLALAFCLLAGASQFALAAATPPAPRGLEKATFAGGCFWCMEPPFIDLKGVHSVTAGFVGGSKVDPTYEQVSAGGTGHAEAVEIVFDPAQVRYEELLAIYWRNIDPTAKDRQFCDRGEEYRSAIFAHGDAQLRAAQASKEAIARDPRLKGAGVQTQVVASGPFYAAEEYHQQYFRKNPVRYKYYRWNCGRDQRLEEIWGKAPAH